jgi:hypothetical protein
MNGEEVVQSSRFQVQSINSCSDFDSLLKNLSESFDTLRTNGERFELPEKFPFMLSLSKHSLLFSTAC